MAALIASYKTCPYAMLDLNPGKQTSEYYDLCRLCFEHDNVTGEGKKAGISLQAF